MFVCLSWLSLLSIQCCLFDIHLTNKSMAGKQKMKQQVEYCSLLMHMKRATGQTSSSSVNIECESPGLCVCLHWGEGLYCYHNITTLLQDMRINHHGKGKCDFQCVFFDDSSGTPEVK